ncbi:hypothetical protein [Chitinophaga sp. CF418]|uniref:hypothetical protein n=1 Tax=Chitinophaga sp. CF418 TaxID=1855287 RepID=UPI00122D05FA|nr:hypothetical protein [Chitinophaga sp. CF418]
MLQKLEHDSYETWVEQFLDSGTKEYEVTENNTRHHVSTRFTEEERASNENTILQLVIAHAEKKEYRSLCMMGEYLRAHGHFYWDATPVMCKTLQLLLQQANETIDNEEVFKDPYVLCLANSVYDIVFHQIRFGEYGLICETLYNQLIAKIEGEKFVQSWQDAKKNFVGEWFPDGYYEQCNYFINFGKGDEEEDDDDSGLARPE